MSIYVVSDISQLCMKLASGRKKDLDDIALLVESCFHSGISEAQIRAHFNILYGGTVQMKSSAVKTMQRKYKQLSRK